MSSWRDRLAAWFPFGGAPLAILVIGLLATVWQLLNPVERHTADVELWTFAAAHYQAYKEALPDFEAEEKVEVDLKLVAGGAPLISRLRAAFWADLDVPDLVEVEITQAGGFFQGVEEDIGFIDLKPFLEEDKLLDRIVQSRFSPFSHRGRIYGMPHDVHPVMLGYRKDLFEKAGIDPAKIETWDDLIRAGRRITRTSDVDPDDPVYMIEMSRTGRTPVDTCLLQRGGGYFDADGNLIMDNEISVQNLLWYVPLVAGPDRIGVPLGWGQPFVKAVTKGSVLCFFCPDWRSKLVEQWMPHLRGKLALMPLPAFERGGLRTSTWGGTMIGITRKCKDKKRAWRLAKHLYLNMDDLERRFLDTNILPPVKEIWASEAFQAPRDFWGGQRLGKMYAELAVKTPPQYANPYLALATSKLAEALSTCVTKYEELCEGGLTAEERKEFEAFARDQLKYNADEVRRQMRRNPF
jgi:arabinosaccharide transport system substrate-binding protein